MTFLSKEKIIEPLITLTVSVITIEVFSPLFGKTIANYFPESEAVVFSIFLVMYLSSPVIIYVLGWLYYGNNWKNYLSVKLILLSLLVLNGALFLINLLFHQTIINLILILCAVLTLVFLAVAARKKTEIWQKTSSKNRTKIKVILFFPTVAFLSALVCIYLLNLSQAKLSKGNEEKVKYFCEPFELNQLLRKYDRVIQELNVRKGEFSHIYHGLNFFDYPLRKVTMHVKDGFSSQYSNNEHDFRKISTCFQDVHHQNDIVSYASLLNFAEVFGKTLQENNSELYQRYKDEFSFSRDHCLYYQLKAGIYYSEVLHQGLVATYFKLSEKVKKQHEILFKRIQLLGIFSLCLLLTGSFSLYISEIFLNDHPGAQMASVDRQWVSLTISIITLLMLAQLSKPIDIRLKNLNDYAWPFSFANWYLPHYMDDLNMNTETLPTAYLLSGANASRFSMNRFEGDIAWFNPPQIFNPEIDWSNVTDAMQANQKALVNSIDSLNTTIKTTEGK